MRLATSLGLSDGIPVSGGVTPFVNTKSLDFDGVDDYVDCGDIDALDNVSTFTISVWFKLDGTGNNDTIFAKTTDANNRINIIKHSNGILYFQLQNGGNGYLGVNFSDLGWNHVAMVFDGSQGGTIPAAPYYQAGLQCYLNGSKITTFNVGSGTIPATTPTLSNNFLIGEYDVSAGYELAGKVDELSIWSTALSDANISTLWNDGTPNNLNTALATTPVNWYRMGDSGTFFNSNWEIPEQTKIDNWSSHSFDFDGIDGTIDCGNDNSLDLVGTDFSVSFWIKPDTTHNGLILDRYLSSDGWGVYDNSGTLKFYDGVTFRTFSPTISLTNGVWQHILITGNTATNTLSCYKDGGSASSVTFSAITSVTDNFIIGSQHGTGFYFNGKMDEISIFDSIKAVADVNDGTKPIDLTGESGLIGWWRSEDATFSTNWSVPDNSSNSNDGTSSGMAEGDKINNAPDNINQGLTSGMVEGDRVEDTP